MKSLEGSERARYIREMFGRIADRYDRMNRLMTFGQDNRWRRFVAQRATLSPGGRLLDLASGTGDIAVAALALDPTLTVVGVDFSLPMMRVGRRRHCEARILWCQSDALSLPFPDHTFDAVVSGYLLRNLVNLRGGLAEQVRVVRPGGMVVALDTTPPPPNAWRPLVRFYLRHIIPLLGRLVAGAPEAYQYLPDSTQAFRTPVELVSLMQAVGLSDVAFRTFMFGTMAVHWGRKSVS